MALSFKDKETDRLAGEIDTLAGEMLTGTARLLEIGGHCAALPDFDTRSPDEIVGYDENGMWG
jgi:hypothetical protein